MSHRTTASTVLLALALTSVNAVAGLPTINPALKQLDLPLKHYVDKPVVSKVTVPKSFLDKSYLFGAMVEACTDNFLTLGAGSGPYKVRWSVEGGRALMLLDQRDRVPNIGGAAEDALNRFPMTEVGDNVEIDLAHPELTSLEMVADGSVYSGARPGYIYDVVQEPGYVSWGEKYICRATGQVEGPGQMTVAVKYYLLEAVPSTTFKAKVYPDEDANRYGFFTTTIASTQEHGNVKPQELAQRWDLAKKIVYLLHPSIPQQYRETFRQCVLSWNKVFLKANGIEPIECRDGKDNELPGDIRSHVLYWVDYPSPYGNGAIGPSSGDPETGEIIDGDVIFYADSYRESIVRLRKLAAAGRGAAKTGGKPVKASAALKELKASNPRRNRGFSLKLGPAQTIAFAPRCSFPLDEAAKISTLAHADITTMTDEEVIKRMIQETIPHEIGHTLGLRHNFKATADVKNVVDNGDSTSVMDYEIDLQALTEPGPYDVAAIAFGYEGDKALFEGKDYFYATDGSEESDPLSNQWDTGDVLAFHTSRFSHLRKLRDADYFTSLASYARSQKGTLQVVRKFVGSEDAKQGKKAFAFLIKVLSTKAAEAPFEAIERLVAMATLLESNDELPPLDEEQRAVLAQALAANVVTDGDDDFDTRLAAVEALVAMKNIYGYKALQAVSSAYEKVGAKKSGAKKSAPGLPPQEQEVALRVAAALARYFEK